jgi:hypothetical protein
MFRVVGSIIREFFVFARGSWYLTPPKASDEYIDKYGWLYSNDSEYGIMDGLFYHDDEYPSVMKKNGRRI